MIFDALLILGFGVILVIKLAFALFGLAITVGILAIAFDWLRELWRMVAYSRFVSRLFKLSDEVGENRSKKDGSEV
jgi:hypothetical protein